MGPGGWRYFGLERPTFAERPGAGQESVWDYPRPPRVDRDTRRILVRVGTRVLADTTRALRVCETASPPTFYLPLADVDRDLLEPAGGASFCEWKGRAAYWSVRDGDRLRDRAGWSYPEPRPDLGELRDHLSFYPAVLACTVAGAEVQPQPGSFYGGWVTPELVGPFKGEPGSEGW